MSETASNQFRTLREASSRAGSASAPFHPPTCPENLAVKRAAILLGCYRKGEAEEPKIYAAAIASVLSKYPPEIAYRVTDPRTGVPSRSQWLPSVAEMTTACELEMAPLRAQEDREARRAHTLAVLASRGRKVRKEEWDSLAAVLPATIAARQKFRAPEQLAAEYAANPVLLSDELRARFLGLPLNEGANG